ncbi:hypothetical protein [Streptomyces sp. 142MFCol3.1]|uniref:hypothetical protein n=1 Tax=Streptomyces sp. 142MFCol3.1 TaxID=1172179 RepID=UPI000403185C|nr:hypothetical protein [Streptomyces sp. 142MFCol3.1]
MHDHRRLGRELDLFDTDPPMGTGLPHWLPDGTGLPYWLPDGTAVRHALAAGPSRRAGRTTPRPRARLQPGDFAGAAARHIPIRSK